MNDNVLENYEYGVILDLQMARRTDNGKFVVMYEGVKIESPVNYVKIPYSKQISKEEFEVALKGTKGILTLSGDFI